MKTERNNQEILFKNNYFNTYCSINLLYFWKFKNK